MVVPLSHGFQKILLTTLAKLLPNIELTRIINILLSKDEYFPWNMTLHWGCCVTVAVSSPVITAGPDPWQFYILLYMVALSLSSRVCWLGLFHFTAFAVWLSAWTERCTRKEDKEHSSCVLGIVASRAGVSMLFLLFTAHYFVDLSVYMLHIMSAFTLTLHNET